MRGIIISMNEGHTAELLHGNVAVLVLKVLSHGPRHAYGIKRELYEQTAGYLGLAEGRLYPLLQQLEKRGLVSGAAGVSHTGRRVREYRIRQAGRVELAAQLKAWELFVDKVNGVLKA
jgi:PadR family transcriptional regulator, regulatory protein PadR